MAISLGRLTQHFQTNPFIDIEIVDLASYIAWWIVPVRYVNVYQIYSLQGRSEICSELQICLCIYIYSCGKEALDPVIPLFCAEQRTHCDAFLAQRYIHGFR